MHHYRIISTTASFPLQPHDNHLESTPPSSLSPAPQIPDPLSPPLPVTQTQSHTSPHCTSQTPSARRKKTPSAAPVRFAPPPPHTPSLHYILHTVSPLLPAYFPSSCPFPFLALMPDGILASVVPMHPVVPLALITLHRSSIAVILALRHRYQIR